MKKCLLASLAALCLLGPIPTAQAAARPLVLDHLVQGEVVRGFRAVARYRDGANKPMGARFVHIKTGFTVDLLQIQSVAQGFIWVNSWPTSDMGEPHTQEHLLLGKGNKGRMVANLDSMSLAESTAYTEQLRTVYQFNTAAGPDAFFNLFDKHMDALLHPDYSDEEIRREVRNFGVSQSPKDTSLKLEEKGTVYNEMVSTFERPWERVYRDLNVSLYGARHPNAYVSGGSPEALRVLTPAAIRKFHDANYHLANMGMIGSFPTEVPLGTALQRLGSLLEKLEPRASRYVGTFKTVDALPKPQAVKAGGITIGGFPDENPQAPGQLLFAWPASQKFAGNREQVLAELFTSAIAGDATTNLYKKFIDTKTRALDLGASGVSGYVDAGMGHPIVISFSDVKTAHLTREGIDHVRTLMTSELGRIAAWPDGAPELVAFNARVHALVNERHRGLGKFVNSPPGFGFRGGDSAWLEQLERLDKERGFDKSVTMDADLATIERQLAGKRNVWRGLLAKWQLTKVVPTAIATRPDPTLVKRDQAERETRVGAELARLEKSYGLTDAQKAIRRYNADYDAATHKIEAAEAATPLHFIDHPPLGQDPALVFRTQALAHQIPLVASTFDNMTSATIGLALRVDDVPQDRLMYLSLLPALLTHVGVIENGKPISYDQMSDRLRNEILSLSAYYSRNARTRRCELVIRGSGNNVAESLRAIDWMQHVAFLPNWRPDNLARMRDLVDQSITDLHDTMKGSEESWVDDPADAFAHQDDRLQLTTGAFLTVEHNAHRLRWQLKDTGTPAQRDAATAYLSALAGASAKGDRPQLQALIAALQGGTPEAAKVTSTLKPYVTDYQALPLIAKATATDAVKDLGMYLSDLPDSSLKRDWSALLLEMGNDMSVGPTEALARLDTVRKTVLNAHKARMFVIGAKLTQQKLLEQKIPSLLAGLATAQPPTIAYGRGGLVSARLQGRVPGAQPIFVGLVNPNTQSGVFLNRAPSATYHDVDRESLLGYLAGAIRGGGGAHSMFMKTWAAGLAYSNGLNVSASRGVIRYYAERCPELPQTLRFVIGEVKAGARDPGLVQSAIAIAFDGSRVAMPYESRGEAMASDLADGITPSLVQRFHRSILALRSDKQLVDELYNRMPAVYGKVLPGLSVKAKDVQGGVYFVIGPEKQMELYEAYLKSTQGADTTLYRLYPRDFWDLGTP